MSVAPSVLAQEGSSPTETAEGAIESGVEGFVDLLPIPEEFAWLVENLINPGLTILLVLFLAAVLSRIAKRSIRRGVERMKSPESTRGGRRRSRNAADDEEAVENLRRAQRADALGNVATSLAGVVIWSIAAIMALGQIDVQLGPLIAGAGIVGVAVGFGAQDLVKDFLSGVFMLIEDQYGVGDIIDAGEASGVVEGITLRSTRLRSIDGTLWHIPNGEIRRVGNMTQEYSRALVDVGIAYGADIDAAVEVIEGVSEALAEDAEWGALVIDSPRVLGVEALGADSVDIRLLVKTVATRQFEVARELRRRIKYAFDAAGIEIPFAQRTVWLRTEGAVAIGDGETPGFDAPVPDAGARRAAIESTRRKDGEVEVAPDGEEAVVAGLPDAPDGGEGGDGQR
ncbi:MAG: mechanosensitive ion channel family protein [Nitriliruptoraceae bacterium]|nr:mechanosensitive ion channel family protein [Nitriliruptoraceae bacterium]